MPIEYTDSAVRLVDIITVAEAEGLLEWLQAHPAAAVDLAACHHLHAANLQVLMAVRRPIMAWPTDPDLATWLENTLNEGH